MPLLTKVLVFCTPSERFPSILPGEGESLEVNVGSVFLALSQVQFHPHNSWVWRSVFLFCLRDNVCESLNFSVIPTYTRLQFSIFVFTANSVIRSHILCAKGTSDTSSTAKALRQSNAICTNKAMQFISKCTGTVETCWRGEKSQGNQERRTWGLAKCK